MKEYNVIISDHYDKMINYMSKKWENETGDKYSISDIFRVCIGIIYDMEKENNSLNIPLTNTSKP